MTKLVVLFFSLVAFCFTGNVFAADVQLLNATFVRGDGPPITVSRSFPGISGSATIEVVNGGLGDPIAEKVSSSIIKCNGTIIFDSSSFNQNITSLKKNIIVKGEGNTLEVTVKGKPEGKIAVIVTEHIAAEAAAVVGPSGGVVNVSDTSSPVFGAKCIIPANALLENKLVTIKQADDLPSDSGKERGIGKTLDFGPSGTIFNVPVTIVLPYKDQELQDKSVLSENLLKVYNFDIPNKQWVAVAGSSVDTANKTVSTNVTHFSYYTVNGDRLYDVNSVLSGVTPTMYDWSKRQILFVHGIQLDSMDGYAHYEKDTREGNPFGNAQEFLNQDSENQVWHLSYDSWSSISDHGKTLAEAVKLIKKKVAFTPNKKITIIAHSEGGLVTRRYVEDRDYGDEVEKILLLGTPNYGSYFSYAPGFESLPAMQQMQPSSDFLNALNDPQAFDMLKKVSIIKNVFSTDIRGGDGIVSADRARLQDSLGQSYPNIHNIELQADLGHSEGIAYIMKTDDYPSCDNKDTCNHPSWLLMKDVVGVAMANGSISLPITYNGTTYSDAVYYDQSWNKGPSQRIVLFFNSSQGDIHARDALPNWPSQMYVVDGHIAYFYCSSPTLGLSQCETIHDQYGYSGFWSSWSGFWAGNYTTVDVSNFHSSRDIWSDTAGNLFFPANLVPTYGHSSP